MRILLAAAAALLAATAAFADQAEGRITSLDTEQMIVVLDDGETYHLPPEMDASELAVGVEVLIAYDAGPDGVNQITDMDVLQ